MEVNGCSSTENLHLFYSISSTIPSDIFHYKLFHSAETSSTFSRLFPLCHYYNSTKAVVFHLYTQCYFSCSSLPQHTEEKNYRFHPNNSTTNHSPLSPFYIEFPLLLLLKLYACQKPTKDEKEEKEWMGSFTKDVDVIHNEPNQIRESR